MRRCESKKVIRAENNKRERNQKMIPQEERK
jgi:hypothetical protein